MLKLAELFATAVHAGQPRKYVDLPYITHVREVADIVATVTADKEIITAAWLHDTVEDCGVRLPTIRAMFSRHVADLVQALTDTPPAANLNREKRKAMDIARLEEASPAAQTIKLADLISNTSTIVKYDPGFALKYLPEKLAVLAVLKQGNPALLAWASHMLERGEADLEAWLKTQQRLVPTAGIEPA